MIKQNLTCPPLFQWFLNDAEVYRYVPEAKRELQRMEFNTASVKIDLESSKMIGEHEHLLVLQSVSRRQKMGTLLDTINLIKTTDRNLVEPIAIYILADILGQV